jgi:hypothetical protein
LPQPFRRSMSPWNGWNDDPKKARKPLRHRLFRWNAVAPKDPDPTGLIGEPFSRSVPLHTL